jgi:hypothetical protein
VAFDYKNQSYLLALMTSLRKPWDQTPTVCSGRLELVKGFLERIRGVLKIVARNNNLGTTRFVFQILCAAMAFSISRKGVRS